MTDLLTRTTVALDVATAYNYAVFPLDGDGESFKRFPTVLPVGAKAPDFTAIMLDGGEARLSDFTRRGLTVIEFGSLT